MESLCDWLPASERASKFLLTKVKDSREIIFFKNGLYQFMYNDKDNRFSQSRVGYLTELPLQDDVDNFRPVAIWAAPPGSKSVSSESDMDDDLREKGWEKVTVGTTPEFEQPFTRAGLKTMRRQYGLQHYVSSMVHGIQGSTLQKLASQISNKDAHYRLWEKGQLVVLLSRTKRGVDTIFVGNKEETLDMLCEVLCFCSQFMEYMEHILDTLSGKELEAPVVEAYMNPYRPCDTALPRDASRYCYLLVSSRDWTTMYIGTMRELHC
jgi:hypothetical protein